MKKSFITLTFTFLASFMAIGQKPIGVSTIINKNSSKSGLKNHELAKVGKNSILAKNGIKNYDLVPSRKFTPKSVTNTIFYEDFDGVGGSTAGGAGTYAFPTGWFLRNVDNRPPNAGVAYVNDAWERREDFANNTLDSVAFSTSWTIPAGQSDDWMWTPLIAIPANATLKWNAVAYDPNFPDGYEVRAMTTTPTGGSGNIGNQLTASTQIFTIPAENSTWTARSVSLSAYAGQSIHIGFRNNSNDKFLLVIDDVLIENEVPIDVELVSIPHPSPYTMIPLSQVTPITFGGTVRNNSIVNLTNVGLSVNLKLFQDEGGVDEVNTWLTPPTGSLAPGANHSFPTGAVFTPQSRGIYELKYYPTLNETDEVSGNDTLVASVYIDPQVYARDNSVGTGTLGIGAGVEGMLGTLFTINSTVTLKDFAVAFAGMTAVHPFFNTKARIYGTTAGVPNNNPPIWESDFLHYDATELTLHVFDTPDIVLTPGSYWFGCVEIDSTLKMFHTDEIFTPNTNFVRWATSPYGDVWKPIETYGANFAKTLIIRPSFKCPTNLTQTANFTSGLVDKVASNTITATNQIQGAKVEYNAGKSIILNPGFRATGNRFKAEIGGCN